MPAKIDRAVVQHVARLAHITLTLEEEDTLIHDLGEIVSHFSILEEIDTSDVSATEHVLSLINVMSADEVQPSMRRNDLLANAPSIEDGYFRTRSVLE
jgi:aspartyl-tRNA(Asn)/glutamyl-tRNA(Gln) amidotransferase subunit C